MKILIIRSDVPTVSYYKISGKGATEAPFNLFIVDRKTGEINITQTVDREECSKYKLKGHAYDSTGKMVESSIDLEFFIDDVNDNIPFFPLPLHAEVPELSKPGTVVLVLNATDGDDQNTANAQLAYQILNKVPDDGVTFFIDNDKVILGGYSPDREACDLYTLIIQVKDLNGAEGCLSSSTTAQIKILDVNDNFPILEKDNYEGTVEENAANVEVMRIKVLDADLIGSDNWLADFQIESGKQGEYFMIEMNESSNEGRLILKREVDFEEMQLLELALNVRNKAEFHESVSYQYKSKSIPFIVRVKNIKESSSFSPNKIVLHVTEEKGKLDLRKAIGRYAATNKETGQIASKVRYAKGYDPNNWLIVDSNTAEIKLAKMPDRESPYLTNSTYTATILAITDDMPATTATGTVEIEVKDFNDHCPTLITTSTNLCRDDKSFIVTAVDEDIDPNSAPFTYTIIDEPQGTKQWTIKKHNDTSALIRVQEKLWPGRYAIKLMIQDQQGKRCQEDPVLNVHVCTCKINRSCAVIAAAVKSKREGISMGSRANAIMILGLLLLLIVPVLLLTCSCRSNYKTAIVKHISGHSEGNLLTYALEGIGEDKDILLLPSAELRNGSNNISSTQLLTHSITEKTESLRSSGRMLNPFGALNGGATIEGRGLGLSINKTGGSVNHEIARCSKDIFGNRRKFGCELVESEDEFNDIALPDGFLQMYYFQKEEFYSEECPLQVDSLLEFSNEDNVSVVSSIELCSGMDERLHDSFFIDLDSKFKILAEICTVEESYDASHKRSMVRSEESSVEQTPLAPSSTLFLNQTWSSVKEERQTPSQTIYENGSVTEYHRTISSTDSPSHTEKNLIVSGAPLCIPQVMPYTNVPIIKVTRYVEPQIPLKMCISDWSPTIVPGDHGALRLGEIPHPQNVFHTERRVNLSPPIQGGVIGIDSDHLCVNEIPIVQNVVLQDQSGVHMQGSLNGLKQGILCKHEILATNIQKGLEQRTLNVSETQHFQNVSKVEKRKQTMSHCAENKEKKISNQKLCKEYSSKRH
ncbi:desmoglein-2-like isoform X2 [Polypterus senegalus]|uniref:desmoglein-2-like isoform X2 n=1 Tax=Polypterus senegalus TaxID=55291 RepID=UPI001964F1AC|nr:desmoglein-2-like isoform X2 [Polypterus senegalus]